MSQPPAPQALQPPPVAPSPGGGWIRWGQRYPDARLRLVCLPHAGGAASAFRGWAQDLGPRIEVLPIQYPGRENRFALAPFTRMAPLVEELARALRPELDRPYAIYGHSLGALIGFELARRLRREGGPMPLCLFAASRRAPHLRSAISDVHKLPDAQLVTWLQRAAGTDSALLNNRRWLRYYLPALRADLEVSEDYEYRAEAPLPCPIAAFGGSADRVLAVAELAAWRDQTSAAFELQLCAGGHLFYLSSAPADGAVPAFEPAMLRAAIAHQLRDRAPAPEVMA
jgi:medium-chain acyl-[acyl-carrier-protein] hydrolase